MTTARELVDLLGGHASTLLGLDLLRDDGRWRWLVVACLSTAAEERARDAYRALATDRLDARALADAAPERVAAALEAAGLRRPERAALTLVRAARSLGDRPWANGRRSPRKDDAAVF
jgi:hypothetical protein